MGKEGETGRKEKRRLDEWKESKIKASFTEAVETKGR